MKKRYFVGQRVQLIDHRGKPHTLWYDGDRPVLRVAKGNSLEEKKAHARKLDVELCGGQYVRDSRKFAVVCEAFLEDCVRQVARGRSGGRGKKMGEGRFAELRGHIRNHLSCITLSCNRLTAMTMQEIDSAVGVQIRKRLADKLTPQTANKVLNTMSRICVFAIEEGDMKSNPMRDVDRLEVEERREDYTPTANELRRVISAAKPRFRPIIQIAAMTGLRVGELRSLRWSDIGDDVLSVERSAYKNTVKATKTSNGERQLQLSKQAREVLKAWQSISPDSEFVFPTTVGTMDSADNWRSRGLHPACEAAGVRRFGWHGLRRFYINSLLDAGAPKDYVQKLVGHAVGSNVTDAHYRRIRDEDVLQDDLTVTI